MLYENDKKLNALKENIANIKKIIVVISGKGGVGKSSTASNLAAYSVSLSKNTGLLDFDVHGPGITKVLGLENKKTEAYDENLLIPVQYNYYLKVISIAFFLSNITDAIICRGPGKYCLMKQFLKDVKWGDLEYVIVDCPPGTGDEPLGLIQLLEKVTGAVVVTTPQDVSLNDVMKSITFCKELKVPGPHVIENMSGFFCPECKTRIDIFMSGGGKRMADESDLPVSDCSNHIPDSDVVLILGTTLINKTFSQIYEHLNKIYNIMLGPGTPLTEILYDYKIDAICGAIIEDKFLAKQYLSQVANYREAKGIKFVSILKK